MKLVFALLLSDLLSSAVLAGSGEGSCLLWHDDHDDETSLVQMRKVVNLGSPRLPSDQTTRKLEDATAAATKVKRMQKRGQPHRKVKSPARPRKHLKLPVVLKSGRVVAQRTTSSLAGKLRSKSHALKARMNQSGRSPWGNWWEEGHAGWAKPWNPVYEPWQADLIPGLSGGYGAALGPFSGPDVYAGKPWEHVPEKWKGLVKSAVAGGRRAREENEDLPYLLQGRRRYGEVIQPDEVAPELGLNPLNPIGGGSGLDGSLGLNRDLGIGGGLGTYQARVAADAEAERADAVYQNSLARAVAFPYGSELSPALNPLSAGDSALSPALNPLDADLRMSVGSGLAGELGALGAMDGAVESGLSGELSPMNAADSALVDDALSPEVAPFDVGSRWSSELRPLEAIGSALAPYGDTINAHPNALDASIREAESDVNADNAVFSSEREQVRADLGDADFVTNLAQSDQISERSKHKADDKALKLQVKQLEAALSRAQERNQQLDRKNAGIENQEKALATEDAHAENRVHLRKEQLDKAAKHGREELDEANKKEEKDKTDKEEAENELAKARKSETKTKGEAEHTKAQLDKKKVAVEKEKGAKEHLLAKLHEAKEKMKKEKEAKEHAQDALRKVQTKVKVAKVKAKKADIAKTKAKIKQKKKDDPNFKLDAQLDALQKQTR